MKQIFDMGEKFAGLGLGSSRLEKRFAKAMETLSAQPERTVHRCKSQAEALRQMAGRSGSMLPEQDTVSLNHSGRKKTVELGYVDGKMPMGECRLPARWGQGRDRTRPRRQHIRAVKRHFALAKISKIMGLQEL